MSERSGWSSKSFSFFFLSPLFHGKELCELVNYTTNQPYILSSMNSTPHELKLAFALVSSKKAAPTPIEISSFPKPTFEQEWQNLHELVGCLIPSTGFLIGRSSCIVNYLSGVLQTLICNCECVADATIQLWVREFVNSILQRHAKDAILPVVFKNLLRSVNRQVFSRGLSLAIYDILNMAGDDVEEGVLEIFMDVVNFRGGIGGEIIFLEMCENLDEEVRCGLRCDVLVFVARQMRKRRQKQPFKSIGRVLMTRLVVHRVVFLNLHRNGIPKE